MASEIASNARWPASSGEPTVKKQVGTIEAIPSKRLFLSIIADYDLNRSICELVDNAPD